MLPRYHSWFAIAALVLCLGPVSARAQAAGGTPPAEAAATSAGVPAAAAAHAASPSSFDPEAATRAYLDRFTPEQRERSNSYFEGGYWLLLWGSLYALGVSYFLLASRLSARMRDLAARLSGGPARQSWFYALFYLLATFLLGLPLAIYEGFFREHKYGLATQTFGAWMGDQGKGLGVTLVLGGLGLVAIYAVLRRAPKTWWIWVSVVAVAFLIFGATIAPVYIEPLFNKYTPLTDASLRDPILSLARANGIPAQQVFVVDASKQTTRVSANVSGMFGSLRIALNDNLLHRASPPAIRAVMGHEMGHYVLNHVYEMIPELGLLIVFGVGFTSWGFGRLTAGGRGERWGVRGVADPAGLPVFALLLTLFGFFMTPFFNTIVRTNEAEADIFGLNASREPDGMAEAALLLGDYRKLEPGPIEEWIFFDHPSGRNRILMAMRWKAEHQNDPQQAVPASQAIPQ